MGKSIRFFKVPFKSLLKKSRGGLGWLNCPREGERPSRGDHVALLPVVMAPAAQWIKRPFWLVASSIGKLSLLCLIGLSSLPVNIANPSPAFGGLIDSLRGIGRDVAPYGSISGWKICNQSGASYLRVAIGYKKINAGWWSEGWWRIPRNKCKKVIRKPLVRRNYYYYAKGYDDNGNLIDTWSGDSLFCIQNNSFDMGENDACLRENSVGFRKTYNGGPIAGHTLSIT